MSAVETEEAEPDEEEVSLLFLFLFHFSFLRLNNVAFSKENDLLIHTSIFESSSYFDIRKWIYL